MPLVELRNVSKIYRLGGEEIRALDDVSLDIEGGEFISIIGPSGSGKSTLMHILGCLDTPSSGTVRLDGMRSRTPRPANWPRSETGRSGSSFSSSTCCPNSTYCKTSSSP